VKLTNEQFKQIIREELENTLNEMPPPQKSDLPGPLGVVSDLGRGMWWAILSHLEETVPDGDPQKPEMIAAVEKQAEKEGGGYPENPNNPTRMAEKKGKNWMKGIKSTGECTPYTKPGCKGRARAYAKRAQQGDIHKDNLKKGKNPHGPGE